MALSAGTRLGPYEIVALLGAGGMGEVYRARDPRLGRDVALKVLPEVFARDAERMARFEREAQVLASLNHPNIASLYGLEESGGVRALVMELVEGPTLAERIREGPLPLDEALPIARQIAEALEAPHEKGIIHRDLKPSNVKVKADGAVKVLDFGLAKALEDDPASSDMRNSPTLSLAATRTGVILGTAAYMSPEQARGKPLDRRADIWAFGVVLFEVLTGQQLFSGETVGDTLAAVIKDEPKWDRLPAGTPPAIRKLLRRCLERDARRRLRDIGEARLAIEDVMAGAPAEQPAPSPQSPPRPRAPVALAALLALALAALAVLYFRETPAAERVLRYSVPAPEKTSIFSFSVSPDGRYLAIAATAQGRRHLWLRALDALQPQLFPGTEDAMIPFWSPDNRWIGFFAQGKLKKIAVNGGPAQTLCDAVQARGGTWNRDGVIVFAPSNTGPLFRVPAVGGVPVPVSKTEGAVTHRHPVFLPDGRRFLYVAQGGAADQTGLHVAALDGTVSRRVLADVSRTAYAPPAAGSKLAHLLFVRENTLMAQPVDPETIQPTGELFPVAEQVSFTTGQGVAPIAVSGNGVLVYRTGGAAESQLTWHDRAGKEIANAGTPARRILTVTISPDEKTVATARSGGTGVDIWLHELARGGDTRFTFHASTNTHPVWSPDGSRLVFESDRGGRSGLYWKDTNGAGQDELLVESPHPKYPTSWSSEGGFLLFAQTGAGHGLWVLPLKGDAAGGRKPVPFLQTEFFEKQGQFSPDGHWVAYASNESGRYEVYVRPFSGAAAGAPAGPGGKWKVSLAGGDMPLWRRDGKELYYLSPERKLMAVAVKAAVASGSRPVFEAGAPQPLFDVRVSESGTHPYQYAVSAGGQRFLVNTAGEATAESPLTVVVNWLAGVRR